MALFFFAVGMEIKREFIFGALSSLRQAILPCLGALGGMIVPMAICVAINLQVSEGERERPNRVCLRRPCWLERRGASCRILYRRIGKMQDFPRLGGTLMAGVYSTNCCSNDAVAAAFRSATTATDEQTPSLRHGRLKKLKKKNSQVAVSPAALRAA